MRAHLCPGGERGALRDEGARSQARGARQSQQRQLRVVLGVAPGLDIVAGIVPRGVKARGTGVSSVLTASRRAHRRSPGA